jgi:hypothetical protein
MNINEEMKLIIEDINNIGFKAKAGMTPLELSKYLSVSIALLEIWRRNATGPSYVNFGRKIIYRKESIAAYLISRQIKTL